MREINRLIIHHSDSAWGTAAEIKGWHTASDRPGGPLPDIGYHFVILNGWGEQGFYQAAMDGVVEYGRALTLIGFHDRGQNKNSAGVCLIGKNIVTWPQLCALHQLTQALRARCNPELLVEGHCENEPPDSGTLCPGDRLRPYLDELRRWLALPVPSQQPGWALNFLTAVLSPP